jgi:uncharacterized RDD family membrane protein YckC
LAMEGAVNEHTLVWRKGMQEWTRLGGVAELASVRQTLPPELPKPTTRDKILAVPLAGPWRRFFARMIDLWFIAVLVALPVGYFGSMMSSGFALWLQRPGSEYQVGWLLVLPILFVEAILFGLTGTTLGKALLGVKVVTLGGARPDFGSYLKRQLGVYWYGLGTGFPLVSLFTMARQSGHLRAGRQAAYDQGLFNSARPGSGFGAPAQQRLPSCRFSS